MTVPFNSITLDCDKVPGDYVVVETRGDNLILREIEDGAGIVLGIEKAKQLRDYLNVHILDVEGPQS